HARHLGRERPQLVHHRVDGVFELQDFAADVDGDLLGQVAVGDGGGHGRDVTHLAGQVAGEEVDGVGEVLPGAGDALDVGLAAQLPFAAVFGSHARHLGRERPQLVHHGVDGVLQLQDFALHVDRNLLGEIPVGDGGGDVGDVAHL